MAMNRERTLSSNQIRIKILLRDFNTLGGFIFPAE